MRGCWNRQTGKLEVLVSVLACGFKSHFPHQCKGHSIFGCPLFLYLGKSAKHYHRKKPHWNRTKSLISWKRNLFRSQTGKLEVLVSVLACGFKSHFPHHKRNLFCLPRQERVFLAFWAKNRANNRKTGFGAVDRLLRSPIFCFQRQKQSENAGVHIESLCFASNY